MIKLDLDGCSHLFHCSAMYKLHAIAQDVRPTNVTYPYDFRETSAASHRVVVTKVRKADFEHADYTGW